LRACQLVWELYGMSPISRPSVIGYGGVPDRKRQPRLWSWAEATVAATL